MGTDTTLGTGISRSTLGTSADVNDSTGVGGTSPIPHNSTRIGSGGNSTFNTGTASTSSTSVAASSPRKAATKDRDQSSWSMLGMFGLVGLTIGLANLFRRPKPEASVGESEDVVEDSFNS
ncbi:MAG: hypothetical protein JO235_13215 [Chroococcidiopsidaceae cyanobacterium CP_BM_RX_35]|nr:hypothetical protein [Chroococcidiopsidaceae cyanobacterium CP_BM_RX_35]